MRNAFEIKVTGDKKVLSNLTKIRQDLLDPKEPLTEFLKIYLPQIPENIRSKGSLFGASWPALKPRTIQKKLKAGFTSQPLINTGALLKSFRYQIKTKTLGSSIPDFIETSLSNIYSTVPYFIFHQLGAPKAKIPQRVILRLDETHRATLTSLFVRWMKNIVRRYIK